MKNTLSILFALSAGFLFAQQSGQIGAFDFLPQSIYANPALRPQGSLNIGIPALSNIHMEHGNNWFKPNELFRSDASGNSSVNVETILSGVNGTAITTQGLGIELLHVGLRIKKHYFHLRAAERVQFEMAIPEDIFRLAVYGNASANQFEDNTADFSSLELNGIHYREYGIGYNYALNEKWSLGLTAKYLYGMERIQTEESSLRLRTDPLTYELQSSGSFIVNTAGIYGSLTDGEEGIQDDAAQYGFGLKNFGFGADLGAVYRPTERLQFELSANDLGFIKWRSDVARYGTDDASFAYGGVDLTEFIFITGSEFNDALQSELDSLLDDLENTYEFERTEEAFSTALNGYLRYGGSYELYANGYSSGRAWGNIIHGLGKSTVPFSYSLGYNQKVWKVVQAGVHYTKRADFSGALGAGLSLNAGFFQIYALAENFRFASLTRLTITDSDKPDESSEIVYFSNPNDIRVSVGVNLTFGMNKTDGPGGEPMRR